MEKRQNKMIIVVGSAGNGKTTTTLKLIAAYPRKALIYDLNDDPMYMHFPRVELSEIANTPHKVFRVVSAKPDYACKIINRDFWGGMVIWDDATVYYDKPRTGVYKEMLTNYRHRDRDMVFVFHDFRGIGPYMYSACNFITLHKTADNPEVSEKKIANYEGVYKAYKTVIQHKDKYYSQTVATRP